MTPRPTLVAEDEHDLTDQKRSKPNDQLWNDGLDSRERQVARAMCDWGE
jgi:hypothetical protein